MLSRFSPACVCLQETMLGDQSHSSPPGYRGFFSSPIPGQGHHGGTAIFVRTDIPFIPVPLQSPLQAVAVKVYLGKFYSLCSLYLPPGAPVARQDLDGLAQALPSPFLLLGDYNGRHPLWNDIGDINLRGTLLASFIEEEELEILNSGDVTHFHSQTGTFTSIDVSLCTSNCLLDFRWRVLPDLYGSDHFPILMESSDSEPQKRPPRWCLDKANWRQYQDLTTSLRPLTDFVDSDEAVTYFTDVLHSSAIQSIPRTSGRFPKRPVPWWNSNCTNAVREKRAAFSRLLRHRDPHSLEEFRIARARARRTLKEEQRRSWRAYLSSITVRTPLSEVFNKVRKISGKFSPSPPPVLSHAGNTVADAKSVADLFASHFASVSQRDPTAPGARYRRGRESTNIDFDSPGGESYNVPFSPSELQTALSQCHDSSPGPDDIPYAFLRHMSDNAFTFLLNLYNFIWRTGDFPSTWSEAVVLPIPKPGKDHLQVSNYRPISLTSCICKLMEKMVNARLMFYLERGNFLTPVQYGFRKVRSTTDALLSLESNVCEAFAKNHHQITVFFDLEKAYDTAWCHGILMSLFEFGLRGHLPVFIKHFLSDRLLRVRVGNTLSEIRALEDGVPQGSILSVTLFAISINGVIGVLPDGVHSSLYVDDLSISFSAARMSLVERKLQLAINRVSRWADERGFRFSPSKTVAMHFCRLRGVHPDPDLYIGNRRISCVETTRYLGLIFDSRLTWVPHLRYSKVACQKALSLLRVLAHTSWGADRDTLLLLHRTLILPKLEYGSEIYSSAMEARLRVLDSVLHAGVRFATGAFRTSPIPSLLVDAGFLPLELRRQSSVLRCWFRVQRLPGSVPCQSMFRDSRSPMYDARPSFPKPFGFRAASLLTTLSIPSVPICEHRSSRVGYWRFTCVQVCPPVVSCKKDVLPTVSRSKFLEHYSSHSNSIPVFTDGSKSDTGVGFGVVFPTFCRGGSLPLVASIYTAELSAIVLALQIIFTLPVNSFIIYTDSRSVLSALNSSTLSVHPLVLSALEWLYILKNRGFRVGFCWVPGHVGVSGNERADGLAREAAARAALPSPVPCTDMFPVIREAIIAIWQERWTARGGTSKMGEVTRTVSRPWTYNHVQDRHSQTCLARLRISHTRLTHSYLMSRDHQPYCDDCLVPLTVRHMLVECPSLMAQRDRFLYQCRNAAGEFLLSRVLGPECLSSGFEVLQFLEETGFLSLL